MTTSEAIATEIGAAHVNVADRLSAMARAMPNAIAVASVRRRSSDTITFAELDERATCLAHGLIELGVGPGKRMVLLVRPGVEFVALVFAILRTGATMVLIDSGLGRRNLIECLAEVEPDGFIAIPIAHAVRTLFRSRFPKARINVTVGRRWFWGGTTLNNVLRLGINSKVTLPKTKADDPAAIVFTSGSTGPPKGVLYSHQTFVTQVDEIRSAYGIEPGSVDLACFPLFGLFNTATGVTTVFPAMDFSRPAAADPRKLLAAANDWHVTQAFASPAVWDKLSRYAEKHDAKIPTLRKVFSCGAPVPADVLRRTLACVNPGAEMHTPYGATEALPIATISAADVLGETSAKTDQGAGVCVGRKFDSIEWRIIRITDEPIATIDESEELPTGEIGELIVRGPQVSPRYVTHIESNSHAKIADAAAQSEIRNQKSENLPWHRTGDVGYFDDGSRFWYCGRKSQRVETQGGPLFTECVEAVFNRNPLIQKSALVGLGDAGNQAAVICILPTSKFEVNVGSDSTTEARRLSGHHELAEQIDALIYVPDFPVDVRHNSKVLRELLRDCASEMVLRDPMLYSDFVYSSAESPANKFSRRPPFASASKQ